jgi:hypothetical protein
MKQQGKTDVNGWILRPTLRADLPGFMIQNSLTRGFAAAREDPPWPAPGFRSRIINGTSRMLMVN